MEIRLEARTLAIGVLLGAVIVIALGASNVRDGAAVRQVGTGSMSAVADKADYGLSVPTNGLILVRIQNGDFFIVNPDTGMAIRVLRAKRLSDDPSRQRDRLAKSFSYITSEPPEEPEY